MWNTIKHTNICITGASEGEKEEKEEKLFEELMAGDFPNVKKIHIQESQQIPSKINTETFHSKNGKRKRKC